MVVVVVTVVVVVVRRMAFGESCVSWFASCCYVVLVKRDWPLFLNVASSPLLPLLPSLSSFPTLQPRTPADPSKSRVRLKQERHHALRLSGWIPGQRFQTAQTLVIPGMELPGTDFLVHTVVPSYNVRAWVVVCLCLGGLGFGCFATCHFSAHSLNSLNSLNSLTLCTCDSTTACL